MQSLILNVCVKAESGLETWAMLITLDREELNSSRTVCHFPHAVYLTKTVCTVDVKDIDLKVASKFFGGRFACGSSVTGEDEIVIQGDVKDELFDVLTEKWPQVCLDCQPIHISVYSVRSSTTQYLEVLGPLPLLSTLNLNHPHNVVFLPLIMSVFPNMCHC